MQSDKGKGGAIFISGANTNKLFILYLKIIMPQFRFRNIYGI